MEQKFCQLKFHQTKCLDKFDNIFDQQKFGGCTVIVVELLSSGLQKDVHVCFGDLGTHDRTRIQDLGSHFIACENNDIYALYINHIIVPHKSSM